MKVLRNWKTAIPGEARPVRFYWFGKSLKEAVKDRVFYVKIKSLKTGQWITDMDPINDRIPSPGMTKYWRRTGRDGDYFVYEP